MDVKKKIMFIVPSMRGGGSERVMSILLKYLSREKFDIILVLLKKEGRYLDDLPKDIVIIDLDVKGAKFAIFKIRNMIRKHKPDIVFSSAAHLNLLISMMKLFLPKKITFIARESSIPSVRENQKYPDLLNNFLYKRFYNNLDLIVCQSKYMMNDLFVHYDIKKEKMLVINNPVDIESINKSSQENDNLLFDKCKINLLTAGRLNKVKGYDLLLQTLAKLDNRYHLTILGEGSEEGSLRKLSKDLNIEYRVSFLGFQKNPYKYMNQSDLFVLSSRYEGFPNVVLEANTCGTPVVAFDCPGGTGEIIVNGLNGFLVENRNIDMLAETIRKSIDYDFNEKKILEFVKKKYEADLIISKYEETFLDEKSHLELK